MFGSNKFLRRAACLLICLLILARFPIAGAVERIWEADELISEQTWLSAVGAVELWKKLGEKAVIPGENVTVAVIDTGLSMSSEFENNIWTNEKELNGIEGVDDDNNGYVDDIHGMSLVDTPPTADTNGHGTMMSGIIAMAAGNGGGVGAAFGAKIMPVKLSKTRSFGIDDLIEGINYAADNGADVINLSVGTIYPTAELEKAVQKASERSIVIAAAGNENKFASDSIYQSKTFPAAYPEVIGVMSTDDGGVMSDFTNWCMSDSAIYELAAPGEKVLSTHLNGAYKEGSGTSQSAAEVSAAAAIMRGLFPGEKPGALRKMLLDCMEHRTAHDEERGGSHRLLWLPDILKAYDTEPTETTEATQPTEATEATEATSPTEPAENKTPEKVKRNKTYTAGKGGSRAKYTVKSVKNRTVYYKKCLVKKSAKTAAVPSKIKLKDGKSYSVIGISPKAFAQRKQVKTITIKSKRLKKSTVKNSLRGSKKQNKKFIAKYRPFFPKCKLK